jgi:hypothetical protein
VSFYAVEIKFRKTRELLFEKVGQAVVYTLYRKTRKITFFKKSGKKQRWRMHVDLIFFNEVVRHKLEYPDCGVPTCRTKDAKIRTWAYCFGLRA